MRLEAENPQSVITESWPVRFLLTLTALAFVGVFLVVPLATVFGWAFEKGMDFYRETIREPNTKAAIFLTLKTALIAVPLNLLFGITAAWSIAKFEFFGKKFLMTLIDLPFTVSPVISGLIFV